MILYAIMILLCLIIGFSFGRKHIRSVAVFVATSVSLFCTVRHKVDLISSLCQLKHITAAILGLDQFRSL